MKTVPELFSGKFGDIKGIIDELMDKKYSKLYRNAVPLSDKSPCDEGVCIRKEGIRPLVLKAKSPLFFEHESKMLDTGEVDLESEESVSSSEDIDNE